MSVSAFTPTPAHGLSGGLSGIFNNIKIGKKISIGFAAINTLLTVIAAMAWVSLNDVSTSFSAFGAQADEAILVNDFDAEVMAMAWQSGEYLLTWDGDTLRQARELITNVSAFRDELKTVIVEKENVENLAKISELIDVYIKVLINP